MNELPLKEQVFKILLEDRYKFHSGEAVSERLGVTRSAVWKEIEKLRAEGYLIESITNKGYRIARFPDLLISPLVEHYLSSPRKGEIYCFGELDSTNAQLQKMEIEGASEGTVVIADSQTQGRGRLGREFYSPGSVGIYMSMLLRPNCTPDRFGLLTSYAGLAICEAMEELCGIQAQIKWPNDIIVRGRKLCGILTKLVTDAENSAISGAVVGLGVNVRQNHDDFPKDLREKAISVKECIGKNVERAQIAAAIIEKLDKIFIKDDALNAPSDKYIAMLKERSCTLGRRVTVISPNGTQEGDAVDIDEQGALIVRLEDSSLKRVFSGEVSVRGLLGYAF